MTAPRLGFIGLGRMGAAMVARLVEAGIVPVVWSRSAASQAQAGEAPVAPSAPALAATADVIIVMTSEAGGIALTADPEFLAALPGRIVVLAGTYDATRLAAVNDRVAAAGARLVEAPVLGTVGPARAGRLVVLAGGAADDVAAVRFTLEPLARAVFHMGPIGSGAAMKAVHNLILSNYWQLLGEALALGGANGLGRRQMLDVIADSPAALAALAVKVPVLAGDDETVGYPIAAMRAELDTVLAAQASLGIALPITATSAARVDRMLAAGWGDRDVAASTLFGLGPAGG